MRGDRYPVYITGKTTHIDAKHMVMTIHGLLYSYKNLPMNQWHARVGDRVTITCPQGTNSIQKLVIEDFAGKFIKGKYYGEEEIMKPDKTETKEPTFEALEKEHQEAMRKLTPDQRERFGEVLTDCMGHSVLLYQTTSTYDDTKRDQVEVANEIFMMALIMARSIDRNSTQFL